MKSKSTILFRRLLQPALIAAALSLSAQNAPPGGGWENAARLTTANLNVTHFGVSSGGPVLQLAYNALLAKNKHALYARLLGSKKGNQPVKIAESAADTTPSAAAGKNKTVIAAVIKDGKESRLTIYHSEADGDYDKGSSPIDDRLVFFPRVFYDGKYFQLFCMASDNEGRFTVYHSRSSDGDSWSSADKIAGSHQADDWGSFFPGIEVKGNRIDVVFQRRQGKERLDDLFYVYSSDHGSSFSSPEQVTNNKYQDFSPSLHRDKDGLHMVWQANKAGWEIFYRRRSNDNWQKEQRVSQVAGRNFYPAVLRSRSGRLMAVWYGFKSGSETPLLKYRVIKSGQKTAATAWVGNEPGRQPVYFSYSAGQGVVYKSGRSLSMRMLDESVKAVKVVSNTHPEGKVVRSNDVQFRWNKPPDVSGLAGFGVILDNQPDSNPVAINIGPGVTAYRQKNLASGNHFFHIRAYDNAGNASKTVHYAFSIDRQKPGTPDIESETHDDKKARPGNKITFTVNAFDDSGIDYYLYSFGKNAGLPMKDKSKDGKLVFTNRPAGKYFLKALAVDRVGNTSPSKTAGILVSTPVAGPDGQPGPAVLLPPLNSEEKWTKRTIQVGLLSSIPEKIKSVSYSVTEDAQDAPKEMRKKGYAQKVSFQHVFKKQGSFFINVRVEYQFSGWSASISRAVNVVFEKGIYGQPAAEPRVMITDLDGDDIEPGRILRSEVFIPDFKWPGHKIKGVSFSIQDSAHDPGKAGYNKDYRQKQQLSDGNWYLSARILDTNGQWSQTVHRRLVIKTRVQPSPDLALLKIMGLTAGMAGLALSFSLVFFRERVLFAVNKRIWLLRG